MTDRRPPDEEDFGAGSGAAGSAPSPAPPPAHDEAAVLAADLATLGLPVDGSADDPIAAVTDFMDDLIEVDADDLDPDPDFTAD